MEKMQLLMKCFFGPRLFHIFKQHEMNRMSIDYTLNHKTSIERWCDVIIDSYGWLATIVKYLSPFIVFNAYKHGFENYITMGKFALSVYFLAYFFRGTVRCFTPTYTEFLLHYVNAFNSDSGSTVRKSFLQKYDFDFHSWNADFRATYSVNDNSDCHGTYHIPFLFKPFYSFLANWIGKPLAYPGSTYLINAIMRGHLDTGRVALMSTRNITRGKLQTSDNNYIDTLFVDNRDSLEKEPVSHDPGKTLVITCEGNAAFYEVGCFEYPLREGYSALGWNHPGFGYSTGIPFATADANAIEAVYQYAVEKLGFAPQDIMVYGWSIGGYATAYIANSHPEIGSIIIDASFDDIIPLAIPRMPEFLGSVTVNCCKKYFNLHNSKLIAKYFGPIRIIRRSQDEIISTNGYASGNRGNYLLMAILETRYPTLFSDDAVKFLVEDWLDVTNPTQRELTIPAGFDAEFCKRQMLQVVDPPYARLGEGLDSQDKAMLAYYIFTKIFSDCEGGHNNPLPRKYFKMPWRHSDEL